MMNRTLPALSALAVTFSLLVFALLQRGAPTVPASAGACLAAAAVEAAPVAPAPVEINSCGDDETRVARAGSPR
jgi:hypothetical protein